MTQRRVRFCVLAVPSILLLIVPGLAQGKEFNVASGATVDAGDVNPGDGNCTSTFLFFCTLRAAVQEANAWAGADTIKVPAGHFVLTLGGINEDGAISGDLDISENLTITGAGANSTVVDAAGIDRVFDVLDGVDATLEFMTIKGGNGSFQYWESRGGGIRVGSGSELDLRWSRVERNQAFLGAAIYGYETKKASISDSEISHNLVLKDEAGLGGTVVGFNPINDGSFQGFFIERTSIVNNRCVNTTGCATGLSLGNCSDALSEVSNTTISGNEGSGLSAFRCEVAVYHSTLYDNLGRGLLCNDAASNPSLTSEVRNSILDSCSLQPECFSVAGNYNQDRDNTCGLNVAFGDQPLTDPMLQPLGVVESADPYFAPTHHPKWVSAMIDSGTNLGAAATDQEGWGRPWDGDMSGTSEYDIGAIETLPCATLPDSTVTMTAFIGSSDVEGCRSVTSGVGVDVQAGIVTFLDIESS